jgi:tetratricopeptide (TPR) repeat protein
MSRLPQLEAIAAKSKKPLPWYGLAMEYRSAGRTDEALQTFQKVHALDRSYVPAWFMRGQLLAEVGRTDEAAAVLQEGIAMAQEVGDAHAVGEMQGLLETLT